jgi:DNA transformation protein
MEPFSYEAQGKIRQVGAYWRVPERLFDEPDEMLDWARAALAAGRRAAADKAGNKARAGKPPQKRRRGPTRSA